MNENPPVYSYAVYYNPDGAGTITRSGLSHQPGMFAFLWDSDILYDNNGNIVEQDTYTYGDRSLYWPTRVDFKTNGTPGNPLSSGGYVLITNIFK